MVTIIADTDMMRQAATQMQQQAQDLESALGQLSSAAGRLNYWEGASYYQFTDLWQQASGQLRTLAQQGQHLGSRLQAAANAFAQTDEQQANWATATATDNKYMPKIEVKVHPLFGLPLWLPPFIPFWHSYIVITDGNGRKQIYQGNPEHGASVMDVLSHGGTGRLTMYPTDHEDGPGITIMSYSGADVAYRSTLINGESQRIEASNTPYSIVPGPFGADCHTTTSMLLQSAGFGSFSPDLLQGQPILVGWGSPFVQSNMDVQSIWHGEPTNAQGLIDEVSQIEGLVAVASLLP